MKSEAQAGRRDEGVKRIDPSGRINLGKERANEIYIVEEQRDGTIVLTPVALIPKRELWLWQNPEALAAVRRGIEQSRKGQTRSLGSFTEFADEPIDS